MTYLIDTHSHFDDPVFDEAFNNSKNRVELIDNAIAVGVRHIVMTGITAQTFERIINTQTHVSQRAQSNPDNRNYMQAHTALGLHPAFVNSHTPAHLEILERYLQTGDIIALGEIGLDTYEQAFKEVDNYKNQIYYFTEQLNLAVKYQLPVLLHIRKSHADALKILKHHPYNAHELGGIAHSFSGGEQEAKAFVKMGFKLGITGQISNPNAKKLRKAIASVIRKYGIESVVIETDCPDMFPWICHSNQKNSNLKNINVPANIIYILQTLHELYLSYDIYESGNSHTVGISMEQLARQLWHNSRKALRQVDNPHWNYPID